MVNNIIHSITTTTTTNIIKIQKKKQNKTPPLNMKIL